ncbi:NUDIX domain-containing protein [Undibacterium fentianense]|uniref:8-oxo-dGTP diphosphatase n=1 Tax=Undibacterium fentianense TaxID=2828728 RepID=A0A941IFQ1_9BURK|nr:NUDIX domain-containing protein [Undibacterium fentianense]MBR7800956.1 NUDIX domain-containing protein [Undibacterium fentianense]
MNASNHPSQITPVNVAVGILMKQNGDVLLGQRPEGKPYAGYWEFPGGKVEQGEEIFAALQREFMEELGIRILSAEPWCCVEYVYPHAHVRLHFYLSREWEGEPQSLEGQAFAWQGTVAVEPLLPATIPLLEFVAELRVTPSYSV